MPSMKDPNVSTIRPGVLVGLKSKVEGGARYNRVDLNSEGVVDSFIQAEEGAIVESWQTTKVIDDPEEFERATKVRNAARNMVVRVCSSTDFGLLCPDSYQTELNEAIACAKKLVKEYNETAKKSFITFRVIRGRIAYDDEEASMAIADEVRLLLQGMVSSIDSADPEGIRESALKMKALSSMLAPEQSEKANQTVEAARKAAREITKRVEKKGEDIAKVLADLKSQRDLIESARFDFLDLSEEPEQVAPENALPGVELNRFDLDMGNEEQE